MPVLTGRRLPVLTGSGLSVLTGSGLRGGLPLVNPRVVEEIVVVGPTQPVLLGLDQAELGKLGQVAPDLA